MRAVVLAFSIVAATFSAPAAWADVKGDATNGEQVFKKCMACHRVGPEAKNSVGPVLNGVIGRKAGTVEGYSYSTLNKAAGESGLVWTDDRILAYLADPNAFLRKFLTDAGKADQASGSTKMPFKLSDEGERADVISYLKQFSKN